MAIGRLIWLPLLLAAVFSWPACDAASDAAQTARTAADAAVTRVFEDQLSTPSPTPAQSAESPEVQDIILTLETLMIADRGSVVEYNRRDWRHWIDADRDCQDTRAETLIEESLDPVSFATDRECRVTGGEWLGPWTGEIFTDASDVDIDHHVPLAHAQISGASSWDANRKRDYANDLSDPVSLQVTSASVNRSKGKRAPDEWRPENRAAWCRYAADWIGVKRQWALTVTEAEIDSLEEMLATCDDAASWGLAGAGSE